MSHIDGPKGPIYYVRDEWGYPRIYARDFNDGTFARGFLHAQDRLLQVHLSLMLARGRLMEIVGDLPFARMMDRAVRSLNLQRDLHAQVRLMQPNTLEMLLTYCQGFNLFIKQSRRPKLLKLLNIPVEDMTPASTLLIYRLVSYFGLASTQHLAEAITAELVKARVPRHVMQMLLGESAKDIDYHALSHIEINPQDIFLAPPHIGGSNAFAISKERSATSGALLMSEFHMEIGRFPPVLYALHIDTPDDYYQGIGIPGLAWLSTGRNHNVGWSYTFGHADNIDILFERCKDGQYLANGQWLPLKVRTEHVRIKGQKSPTAWTFYDNDYGTILEDASREGDFPCVRWNTIHKGASDIDAARKMFDAKTTREFVELQRGIQLISLEAVIADRHGDIASIHTGQIDQRPPNWTGPYPYPGWLWPNRPPQPSPLPESSRPSREPQQQDHIVSANAHTNGKNGETWTSLPETDYRLKRIAQLISQTQQLQLKHLVRISYDEVDLCAQELMAVWGPLKSHDPTWQTLFSWSQQQHSPSNTQSQALMSLFHALHNEVLRGLLSSTLGPTRIKRFLDDFTLTLYFQHHLDTVLKLEKPLLLDKNKLSSLIENAWPRAQQLALSDDWQLPVKAPFLNMITQGQLPAFLGFSHPPIQLPGGPVSPFQSRRIKLYGQPLFFGPAFHYVMDMSQPGGWYNIAGGASESRFGPGYGKAVREWKDGQFLPLGTPPGQPPNLK